MRLTGDICPTDEVSPQDLDQMFSLMQRYYDNIDREMFDLDFREKDVAIIARDPRDQSICGFSTQVVYMQQVGRETVRILFSGDTIVDRRFWGNNPLAQLWGRLALSLIDRYPQQQLYWFLISKGYKTYRFLPVFFQEFYPRCDQPTPEWAKRLIAELASARFGKQFCHSTGILKASKQAYRLSKNVADVTVNRLKDPHIAFFNQVNPGHFHGDELCCIAPLSRANFSRSAFHVIGLPDEQESRRHELLVSGYHATTATEPNK